MGKTTNKKLKIDPEDEHSGAEGGMQQLSNHGEGEGLAVENAFLEFWKK